MDLVEKYKKYRKALVTLHGKILNMCVSKMDFEKSGEMVGIVQNKKMILESPEEKDAIYDFNIYEKIKMGKNSLSEYIEQATATNELEEELLVTMKASGASLYEIVTVEKENGIVMLKDILNDIGAVKVIDIGLSGSLDENLLVFTRLLHLDDFSMTSGLGFILPADHKPYLIKRSRKLMKKINSGDPSVDRFIAFFKLNRSDGLPIILEKIK